MIRWAEDNSWRIPEHFTKEWVADLDCNRDRPDDPFKPYGATPGHGIEWARLITQWALANCGEEKEKLENYLQAAENLYTTAIKDGWDADGAPGLYTQQTGRENLWYMTVCTGHLQRQSILLRFFIM